jgi:hypothetical protein
VPKLRLAIVILTAALGMPKAQAQPEATSPRSPDGTVATCTSQHEAQPGVSAADLLDRSYVIKAAVPGGVWLQKKNEVFYCNAGVTRDDETMCWKLRVPLKGQNCKEAIGQTVSREIPN